MAPELIKSLKARAVESIIRLECDPKKLAIGFYNFRLLQSTMTRYFPVDSFVIGKLNIIARRFGRASES